MTTREFLNADDPSPSDFIAPLKIFTGLKEERTKAG